MTALDALSARYRAFAEHEAKGVSPRYEALALAVAESASLLDFVATLPEDRRQPNLVLAAIRWVCGVAADGAELHRFIQERGEEIREVALARRTQTNEAGRCATLLPLLATLPQPLALLEVGASAGLCLLPDRYGYDYGRVEIAPPSPTAPTLRCAVSEDVDVPTRLPTVVWRRGIDLHPVDSTDEVEARWLETLVWPGQPQRRDRLRAALGVAAANPPVVERGDVVEDLPRVAATAPADATLVVFHSAVLSYLSPERRADFRRVVSDVECVWIANEGRSVFPDIAERAGDHARADRFLLSMNGRPRALTGPHGQSYDPLPE
ncbi:MAG: DUF2332 domain-containing protein [Gemmatimonadota bacterium]